MASGLLGQLQLQTIKTALKYMEKDPEKNLPKLVQWADKIDKTGYFKKYRVQGNQQLRRPCGIYQRKNSAESR